MKNLIVEKRKRRDELLAQMKAQGIDFHSRKRGDREKLVQKSPR